MVQGRLIIAIITFAAVAGIIALILARPGKQKMILTSPSFNQGEEIPVKFTCDGGDVNPELRIQDVPPEAKSLVLIMDDPDAPGGTWTHWTLWNIPPQTATIAEDSAPAQTVQGTTSFGKPGYGGPCPPAGRPHRYFFKLYALDTVLDLGPATNVNELRDAMSGHIIAEAELMGIYQR